MSVPKKPKSKRPTPESGTQPADQEQALQWQQLFDQSRAVLRGFLANRLAQESDIDDCLQTVYVKIMESGQAVAPAARRSWLFRVAANESARLWRSKASTEKMLEQQDNPSTIEQDPTESLVVAETAHQVRQSLEQLPESWRDVMRLRIEQEMTFQMISEQLQIPIGTALTRMRRCLEHLRNELDAGE